MNSAIATTGGAVAGESGNIGVGILIDHYGNWAVWVWLALTIWGLIAATTALLADQIDRPLDTFSIDFKKTN